MQRIGIIVAGMHRSGTSALTRMLGSLGCRLPKTLLEPNEYNALGYWESSEISELNDAILKSAGSSWDDWEAFHQGWYASLVADEFRDHARTVLENEFGDSRLFVLKDPRVCRLLEFWIDALKDIAAAPVIAVTIRNPLEVAASLHHRDMIDPSIGLLLWLRHVLDAEATSRDSRRVFVRYEDLLGNWAETAVRLGRELGVIWPKDSSSSEMEIESYLTPSQRHHARDDDAIFHSPSVSRWVKESFKIVDRWTRGDVRESDGPELDSIRSAFDEAGAVFVRPIVGGMRAAQNNKVLQTEIVNLNDAIVGREKHIGDLDQAVADRDSDVSSLNRVLAAKDSQIESLNQAIADRDVRVDAINHAISDRDGQISTLNRAVAERDGQVNALNLAVADRDSGIADRDGQLEALNIAVADRDSGIADRDGQLEALNIAVADRDSAVADRDGQLEALNIAVADRDSGIADRDGQLEALNIAVADRDSGIADRDGQLEALNIAVADRDSAVADRDGQLEALNIAVADRDSGIADRDGQLEALNIAVADRDSAVADRDGQLEALNIAVADRDSGIADRDGQLEALNIAVADRDSAVADRDGQLEALNIAVADRDSGIADRDGQLEALNIAVADRDSGIADRDGQLEALNIAVADRDSGIADRDGQLEALNIAVADRDSAVADRDGQLEALNIAVADRDSGIADRDGQLEALNIAVADRDSAVADRDGQLEALNIAVADRDSGIADRDGQLEALNIAVADRDSGIADRDGQLEALNIAVADRDSGIADRDGQLEALNIAVADRDSAVADRDGQLEALNIAVADRDSGIADRDGQLEALNIAVADRDGQIDDFRASTSWRITKPLRVLKPILVDVVRAPHRLLGRAAVGTLRIAWLLVPLGRSPKQRIRMSLLRTRFFRRFDRAPEQIPIRTYTSSGRVDLANGNYEAHKNQGHIPILFDPTYYLACNEDIREADIDPLVHYLEYGAVEGRLPIDIEPDEIDPMIRDLHRLDMNANEAFAFDATFYRALYPDLASLPDDKLADHYRRHGQGESRSSSFAEFALQICDNPREIPLDFNPAEYIDLYVDLKSFAEKSPLEALRHYMCHGRWEPRLHTLRGDGATNAADTSSADLELPAELTSSARPLCVLAHVYYPELWDELSEYLSNLPEETWDLYVNLVDTSFSQGLIMRIRETFPSARIYISENVGRDIGGFCQLLRNLRMEDYRLFCLVHTKKSPHMGKGEVQLWRRKLLTPLMGTRERAVENIKLMLMHDEIGLIGSLQCRYTELNDNPKKYFELLTRLGVSEESSDVEFLSGTMMFVRREVLQRVAEVASDIPFERGEGKSLAFHRDGQWAHAVERAFGAVVRDMNYRFEWR